MDILTAVINALIFLALAPFFEGVIRRLYARVQSRKGPPLIQPYLDLLKLLGKETLSAGNWAFRIAPMMALASIITVVSIMPLGYRAGYLTQYGDIITVIYLLMLGGVSVLLGALSSKNTYAMLGASREMVTMIMIEPVLAMTLILGALKAKSLAIDASLSSSLNGAYGISMVLMLVVFLMALQAFVARQPFDIAEAEVEIMEGPFIEYSGPGLALFKYYMMIKQMFYAALFAAVFVPLVNTGYYIVDVAVQLVEILAVFVLISLLGSTNPRLRIDQAVKYYAVLIFASLAAVGLTAYGI
ncbi:MAG TPA: NADH-quinone oxidoreductase subunit H [Spirochaetota bacterium]|nr:NADH-quinone oxidoreductase subunit H [Spirochaetota bacterium]OPZ38930.1 MAG: Formate hydrogenlyase subunit 4 [Spirochaetes bacterium ADurb.BinA120]HNU92667.1 NADH-quinone oxidoreductase subunit H [Spirochaetota bacterium]HPI15248.1 NADH-quinone oxidoreductase subunit H [Spirochaetota bacterium]HPV98405.1 NADH-quinone oxidoreductase subunit H [Spirochaetota bacterium]